MSDTVIKVENLSKSAPRGAPQGPPPQGAISHPSGERYTALRDVLANGVKAFGSNLLRRNSATLQPATLAEFGPSTD